MAPGEWRGKKIPDNNRVLILGESHYSEEENIGKQVPYTTIGTWR